MSFFGLGKKKKDDVSSDMAPPTAEPSLPPLAEGDQPNTLPDLPDFTGEQTKTAPPPSMDLPELDELQDMSALNSETPNEDIMDTFPQPGAPEPSVPEPSMPAPDVPEPQVNLGPVPAEVPSLEEVTQTLTPAEPESPDQLEDESEMDFEPQEAPSLEVEVQQPTTQSRTFSKTFGSDRVHMQVNIAQDCVFMDVEDFKKLATEFVQAQTAFGDVTKLIKIESHVIKERTQLLKDIKSDILHFHKNLRQLDETIFEGEQ